MNRAARVALIAARADETCGGTARQPPKPAPPPFISHPIKYAYAGPPSGAQYVRPTPPKHPCDWCKRFECPGWRRCQVVANGAAKSASPTAVNS